MSGKQIEQVTIDALQKAVNDLFTTMMGLTIVAEEITEDQGVIEKDITGMIGIVGDYKGVMTVYFPEAVAFFCISAMLGMEVTELDADTKDAIGEITNMIIGGAKNFIYEAGIKCEITTPTVVVGKDYQVYSGAGVKKIVIPFSCDAGHFYIDFFLKKAD